MDRGREVPSGPTALTPERPLVHVDVSKSLPAEATAVLRFATAADPSPDGLDVEALCSLGFEGRLDQVVTLPPVGGGGPVTVVVGLGDPVGGVGPTALRRAAAVGVRNAARHASIAVEFTALVAVEDRPRAVSALVEGAMLGAYRFGRYKSASPSTSLDRFTVVGVSGKRATDAALLGSRIGEAQCLARDLVNEPGGSLTPAAFAEVAVEVAEREDLQITVMDLDDITEAGLGGLLGVNKGSTHPPRLVVLAYEPPDPRGTLAIVGKGVTFDSGGLSIKPSDPMMTMKCDMAGAAAVLGAFAAFGAAGVRSRVIGFLPLTDNMVGGDATRPGDVLRMRNGTTVEVLNTDAEGRLILADALCLAAEEQPDAIVDLATLTGAIEIALGPGVAGLMGNSTTWINQIAHAAEVAGEQVWELPMPHEYRRWLDSDVADMRNITKVRSAGSITAAQFLSAFVPADMAWAHLDIAATAWSNETRGTHQPGGTGYGVRLLVELAHAFRKPR